MSEDDEWEKDEVEEVVLTSATNREPAVHATLDSLSRFWSWRTRLR